MERQAALTTVTATRTMLSPSTWYPSQTISSGLVYVLSGTTVTVTSQYTLGTRHSTYTAQMPVVVTNTYTAPVGVSTGVLSPENSYSCFNNQLYQCGPDVNQGILCPEEGAMYIGCPSGTRCLLPVCRIPAICRIPKLIHVPHQSDTTQFMPDFMPLTYPACYTIGVQAKAM